MSAASPVPSDGITKTIRFSESAYQVLTELAKDFNGDLSEALRDAIMTKKWVKDAHKKGTPLLFEENGKLREFVKVKG